MTYDARNLSVLAYANGFTLWHYGTEDSGFSPDADFHGAADLLKPGDIILTSVTPETGPAEVRAYGVVEVHKANRADDRRVYVQLMASTDSTGPGGGVCAAGWSIPYTPSPFETRAVCTPQDEESNVHGGNTP